MAASDVLIVGAGPVGLFTVFQCGMLGLTCQVADVLDQPGGQCSALYPQKPIYDIPAFDSITAGALVERLYDQAMAFQPTMHLGALVERLSRRDDGRFEVGLSTGTTLDVGAIVIAAGAGSFAPNRPELADIRAYEGRSIFYAVMQSQTLAGKNVVIAGGGDSAVDWALVLKDIAASVRIVHRRAKLRGAPESLRQLDEAVRAGTVEMVVPFQLAGLQGDAPSGMLHGVVVRSLEGEERTLEVDVLLPLFGLAAELGPLKGWGLSLVRNQISVEQSTSATGIPGIYAVGDVAAYAHKLKLILTGFAEAAQAAHAVRTFLRPEQAFHFEHSTSRGAPGTASLQEAPP